MSIGSITYDSYGIPTLEAESLPALSFLQGFVSAKDSGWQLDQERRRSYGTTAAVIGPQGVEWDRLARQIDLPGVARRAFAAASPQSREWLSRYAEGVNEGMLQHRPGADNSRAKEWTPETWRSWDSLAIMLGHHLLLTNFPAKFFRGQLLDKGFKKLVAALSAPSTAGSNAWAIPASYSSHAHDALLAADPHRIWEARSVYQQIRLKCPEVDVYGLAFPGVPGVPHFGHNRHVAWVTTSAMANTQDLFELDEDTVLADHGVEVIDVAGGQPQQVEVASTPQGRLLTVAGKRYAFAHPAAFQQAIGVEYHPELLKAQTAQQAAQAVDTWVEPVNRMLFSDQSGAVVSRWAGKVPDRALPALVQPVRCSSTAAAWRGWLDTSEVTTHQEPVVHANEPAVPGSVKNFSQWSVDFCLPDRHDRAYELIKRESLVTVNDLVAWQNDIHISLPAWWPHAIAAIVPLKPELAEQLAHWPGAMSPDSESALWFARVRHALVNVVAECLPPEAHLAGFGVFQPWCEIRAWLPQALDRVLSTDIPELPSPADLIHMACCEALEASSATSTASNRTDADGAGTEGTDSTSPESWGRVHRPLLFDYQGTQDVPVGIEAGGDSDSICATAGAPGVVYRCIRGPVARVVWDVADRSKSQWLVPTGTATEPAKQWSQWNQGRLLPVDLQPERREMYGIPAANENQIGTVSVRTFEPTRDLEWIRRWVAQDHAKFWGMQSLSPSEVDETYTWLHNSQDHTIAVVSVGQQPAMVVHFYNPKAEPIGDAYDVQDGDVGLHIMKAPPDEISVLPALWSRAKDLLWRFEPAKRLVIEPDITNRRAVIAALREGFVQEREVTVQTPDRRSTKQAALCFLDLESQTS